MCIGAEDESKLFKLDNLNVLDYLRFFNFFVRGADGPFWIHERFDPLVFDESTTTEQSITELKQNARSTWILPNHEPDESESPFWLCSAMVCYGDAIFNALYFVESTGMIDLRGDDTVASGLETRVDMPITN